MEKKELENKIVAVLKTVYDPEIPVDIYELGLIYEIQINDEFEVKIIMTLTSPNCPAAESLPAEVEQKVKGLEEVKGFDLEITFEPTWEKSMMSEEAQIELGMI
ncbi:MAG: iron-sulfur cluster assembly protein [Bacteroidetes bacterium]|nr:iron-sulfur cluster assembly protein [Bacteroidota bacterium]